MPGKSKRLRVMAGPNGSGKSTVIERIRQDYTCGPFVNADRIESLLSTNGILYLAQYDGLTAEDAAWGAFQKGAGNSRRSSKRSLHRPMPLPYSIRRLQVRMTQLL